MDLCSHYENYLYNDSMNIYTYIYTNIFVIRVKKKRFFHYDSMKEMLTKLEVFACAFYVKKRWLFYCAECPLLQH